MALPPDEPTRPLPPAAGLPPEPVYRETYVATDDAAFRAEVLDRLDGLRMWVGLATVLSLLALGLAVWAAFLKDEDRNGNRGGGAEAADVRTLEQRIDKLESRGAATADVGALTDSQEALATQVDDLTSQVEEIAAAQSDTAAAPATAEDAEARDGIATLDESIRTLDASVSELDGRVQALEQAP